MMALIQNDEIIIRKTVFDHYDDRTIFLFQLLSANATQEICMLEQIVSKITDEKYAYIFINGHKKNWDNNIVQKLLDTVFAKTASSNDE